MENVIEVTKLKIHPDNWAEYNDGMYLIEESLELYIIEKAEPSYCPCTTDWLSSHIHDNVQYLFVSNMESWSLFV